MSALLENNIDLKNMQPGVYDLSNNDYHASNGVSRSGLSKIKKSPLHYWEEYLDPGREREQPGKALVLGSMVHTLCLEPEKFDSEFAVLEKVDLRTTAGKQAKALFEERSHGKMIAQQDWYQLAQEISKKVIDHPRFDQLMYGANIEQSIYWVDEDTGLLCKTRPDIWNAQISVLCDLKTSADSSHEAFGYSVKNYDYHMQAAMQIDGVFKATGQNIAGKRFCFFVAQTERPHKPYLYTLDERMIELGRTEYKNCLKILKKCQESNKWDKDRDHIIEIGFSEHQLTRSPLIKLVEIYNE